MASNCSEVISSVISMPAIFCTTSFSISRSKLQRERQCVQKANWYMEWNIGLGQNRDYMEFIHANKSHRCDLEQTYLFPAFSWLVTYWRRPASSIGYFLNTAPHRLARPWLTSGTGVGQTLITTSNRFLFFCMHIEWCDCCTVTGWLTEATYFEAMRRWWCRHASSSLSRDWPEPQWCNLKTELRRTA